MNGTHFQFNREGGSWRLKKLHESSSIWLGSQGGKEHSREKSWGEVTEEAVSVWRRASAEDLAAQDKVCVLRKNRKEADGIGWSQTLKGLKAKGTEEFCLNTVAVGGAMVGPE